jgi:hypothetical protein
MPAPVAQVGAGNVTTFTSASASSGTVSKPSNTADGDVLIVAGYFRNAAGTITPGNGFTQLGPINTASQTYAFYSKPIPSAAAESDTSYTFSTSAGSGRLILICFRVTGADLAAILDAQGALHANTGTSSVVHAAVTAVSIAGLLLSITYNNTTTTTTSVMTKDAAMTEVAQATISNGTSATSSLMVAQQQLSASGSTGTRTTTISPAAANAGGFMVTVAPAILVPVNGVATGVSTSQMDLTWDAFPGATGYDVERDGTVIATNVATNAYSDTGLGSGTSHDYRVRAVL